MSVKELLAEHGTPEREVYFDHENSGWVPPEVVEAMLPYFNKRGYGHPSITNKPGWEAYEVIWEARKLLAEALGISSPDEVVFTHSGTEANNLAILGTALASKGRGGKIIVSAIEHLSVIFPAEFAARLTGMDVIKVPVDEEGFVDPEVLATYVSKDTVLVSVQLVNHEIGTIQNVRELAKVVKDINPDALFHTDACDALGRVNIDVRELGVDLLTVSSHKILGPKGAGALYVRKGVRLEPIVKGQLSTQTLWPGVENVPAIAGFKKALELALRDLRTRKYGIARLRDKLIDGLLSEVPHTLLNGPRGDRRSPDNVNVSFLYVEGEALTVELSLKGIYVSSGSACTSRVLEPSHVLLAIGRKHEEAHGSILFKLTRYHSEEDVEYVLSRVPEAVSRLRRISSLKPS